ncbi:DUF1311 domain-containing protein [Phyllobacterium sp. 628]|uniref:lysozyme inhibitor LprI family protein n=1 Tax=Phyllobacterium sp. 628 TaxID=2718938 RepID=UPI0016623525|nr:lysozyme inhibitor LprI family protein [Phyllobacterium sp. 628]QND53225.1 DUF1311 domain-containing protein [Phyllobacterium sp. 628]
MMIRPKAQQSVVKSRLVVSGAALLSIVGFASPVSAKDCEKDATSMAEVRACLANGLDEDLAETLNSTMRLVRAKNPQSADLLMAAQASWKKFADDSCTYSVAAWQTDEMANDARLSCWDDFVRARIKVLNAYRRDFGKTDF